MSVVGARTLTDAGVVKGKQSGQRGAQCGDACHSGGVSQEDARTDSEALRSAGIGRVVEGIDRVGGTG